MSDALTEMLAQLESHSLQVMLVPLNPRLRGWTDGGMKRVCMDIPPKFYRELCAQHPSSRGVRRGKFDTKIRRANILRVLGRLASNLPSRSKYAPELLAAAKFFYPSQSEKFRKAV